VADFMTSPGRLYVSGTLDGDADEEFKEYLSKLLLDGPETVTVDLTEVDFMTSVCMGTLVAFWIDLGAAQRIMDLQVAPEVKRVLDASGLTALFDGTLKGV
jgi:anti-anti-sigma factor